MTTTFATAHELQAFNGGQFTSDEAVPSGAFDLTFDDEGMLYSYWLMLDEETGLKEKQHTARGLAAWEAMMRNTKFLRVEPHLACDRSDRFSVFDSPALNN